MRRMCSSIGGPQRSQSQSGIAPRLELGSSKTAPREGALLGVGALIPGTLTAKRRTVEAWLTPGEHLSGTNSKDDGCGSFIG